ncbi:hypothetical protein BCR32DRAFT_243015 [Anaeromyces robustus]|uniref:Uncharacterized protein n=1 Tax=Anaeromyces robustus TaxID=1754192 RepID=A0A1Y1XDM5_9FUNG|nr:hypothetical protein BCR32DRAFT_243015 [Anaeromyces robustus]|eukprot:ORX83881.1 hypothetical protein BCR32DRAFT_243015 [Anaeromyces robustus]
MCSSLPLFDSNKYKDLLQELNKNLTEEELLRNSFGEMKEYPSHNTIVKSESLDDGVFLTENKNYDNTLNKINELIHKNPTADNYCCRANIYLNIRKYKDAINDCINAFKKDSKCVKAYLINAQCNIHRGNLDKVKENLKKGLELSKENNNLSYNIQNLENEVTFK